MLTVHTWLKVLFHVIPIVCIETQALDISEASERALDKRESI